MTTPTVTKIKILQYYNSKTQMIQNSKCEEKKSNCSITKNSKCDQIHTLRLFQSLQTQIVTTLKNSNCDKIQILKL